MLAHQRSTFVEGDPDSSASEAPFERHDAASLQRALADVSLNSYLDRRLLLGMLLKSKSLAELEKQPPPTVRTKMPSSNTMVHLQSHGISAMSANSVANTSMVSGFDIRPARTLRPMAMRDRKAGSVTINDL